VPRHKLEGSKSNIQDFAKNLFANFIAGALFAFLPTLGSTGYVVLCVIFLALILTILVPTIRKIQERKRQKLPPERSRSGDYYQKQDEVTKSDIEKAESASKEGNLVSVFVEESKKQFKASFRRGVRWRWWFFATFLVLVMSDLPHFPFRIGETLRVALFGLPEQEQMVKDAAAAYANGKCDDEYCLEAIAKARKVIHHYEFSAESEENSLAGVPPPPIGKVGPSVAMGIFDRGSLNSVAYSWWIAGSAYAKLGKFCDSAAAYESAAKLTHARTWDPQGWPLRGWSPFGWFWSPPDDAKFQAGTVSERCKSEEGENP